MNDRLLFSGTRGFERLTGRHRRAWLRAFRLAVGLACAAGPGRAWAGEGTDLEIGRKGAGSGQFMVLSDIAFDRAGCLYVLDGGEFRKGTRIGNFRVQVFDNAARFLREFSVFDESMQERNQPMRLAVDGNGRCYVTQPRAHHVQVYAPDGRRETTLAVSNAYAIARWEVAGLERIVVAGNRREAMARAGGPPETAFYTIETNGMAGPVISLSQPVSDCVDLTADGPGNLYVLAATNRLYKFAPSGQLQFTIGSGLSTRNSDGSESLHSVTVDSKGNLVTMAWGNPGLVTRFDPAVTTVTQREGQFKWADPWSTHSSYVPLAFDPHGRLWAGVVGDPNRDPPPDSKAHARPCVLRTQPDFFENRSESHSAQLLGFVPDVEMRKPYGISYDLGPVPFDFVVKAGNRRLSDIQVGWTVYDMYKNEAGKGRFDLKLVDGREARQSLAFTPPRWGWYTVICDIRKGTNRLVSLGAHAGVTPAYAGMPVLAAGDSPGGWEDAKRQAFCGLMLMRLHPAKGLDKLSADVDAAAKAGVTALVQFSDVKDCTASNVTAAVTRLKGRVRNWEIMNEPNFSMKPEAYAELAARLAPVIKAIDPEARVLGPDVCGISLPWIEAFYKAGGGKFVDILSVHDYEGHESIDPVHWIWKYGALRELMSRYGDAAKPVWQTERAIAGVRAGCFLGPSQAVRLCLHRDLLEMLGIPGEHNSHYYLNQGGYSTVPSYVWSSSGPHPGALALRTRQAMIQGLAYRGALDFGPTGNRFLQGLRYEGASGISLTLRNYGTLDRPVELNVTGTAGPLDAVDAFGNTNTVAVGPGGRVRLTVRQMPAYLRLPPGAAVTAPRIDFGSNIAAGAVCAYSAASANAAALINGIAEVVHAGHPYGDTGHPFVFTGELPTLPQTLGLMFPAPRAVSRVLILGLRADNAFCALLDYDLQVRKGGNWVTLEEVRTPCPPSDPVRTAQCEADTWYLDNNLFVHEFPTVLTDGLRLVVRRTTRGLRPDAEADAAVLPPGKTGMPAQLMLREIEVYP